MKRTLSVLGSTGSIGRQTLEVAQACGLTVAALTANRNSLLLEEQARKFRPKLVAAVEESAAADLKVRLADTPIRVAAGPRGVLEAATLAEADTVVTAVMGVAGLEPTLAAIRQGKRIALANKETMVCAGKLVMDEADRYGAEIVPVDSEHSAIFQCLAQLARVTKAQALRHPNWAMGAKITIDSATLMNKGLELIEAMGLYRMPPEKISIVIHRESIVHSLVEYCDNAVLAQLGAPDMRLPIQYALTWPARAPGPAASLDLLSCPPLTFAAPDCETFECLALALQAAAQGGTAPAVLSGANEAAVDLFLREEIGFLDIPRRVGEALERVKPVERPSLEDILLADHAAREAVRCAR